MNNDIVKLIKTGLMIYGGFCLLKGGARSDFKRRAKDKLEEFLGVKPIEEEAPIIEADWTVLPDPPRDENTYPTLVIRPGTRIEDGEVKEV